MQRVPLLNDAYLPPGEADEADTLALYHSHRCHEDEDAMARLLEAHPPSEGTLTTSVLSLVVSACGAGVLSLPFALRCTGWLAGTGTLLVLAVASSWSLELIDMRARDLGATSYEAIGKMLYGPWFGLVIELLLFVLLSVAQCDPM
ncbi:hypothetical protein T492DRAFT_862313 [Pavlovales sp. CCMP2436]|nr:hypothetical protein T492DRAFT_862313 [Pavlovales sp. CCMP2436]